MTKSESMTNDEARSIGVRHSGFVILSSFVIRVSSSLLVICPPVLKAGDNVSVLAAKPKWGVLEKYQETITRDDFAHLINDVYCTHGFAEDLLKIDDQSAQIMKSRDGQS